MLPPRKALKQPRLQRLLVLATVACVAVTVFGRWWEARVAPQIDNSDTGHYIGSHATTLGLFSAVVLLGALLTAFSMRASAASVSIRLCVASLVISGMTVAGVIAWLLRHPEHADLLWQSL